MGPIPTGKPDWGPDLPSFDNELGRAEEDKVADEPEEGTAAGPGNSAGEVVVEVESGDEGEEASEVNSLDRFTKVTGSSKAAPKLIPQYRPI